MKDFVCRKCGNTTYIVQEKTNGAGTATGLYCAKCGTWHKWLNKQEKVLYTTPSAENKKSETCVICHTDISGELPKIDEYGNRYCAKCYEKKCNSESAEKLPCKVGDTLFIVAERDLRGKTVRYVTDVKVDRDFLFYWCFALEHDEAFWTREEAQENLKKQEEKAKDSEDLPWD